MASKAAMEAAQVANSPMDTAHAVVAQVASRAQASYPLGPAPCGKENGGTKDDNYYSYLSHLSRPPEEISSYP